MVKNKRRFGGKVYHLLQQVHSTKSKATAKCRALRRKGYNARAVKSKSEGGWLVYRNPMNVR